MTLSRRRFLGLALGAFGAGVVAATIGSQSETAESTSPTPRATRTPGATPQPLTYWRLGMSQLGIGTILA